MENCSRNIINSKITKFSPSSYKGSIKKVFSKSNFTRLSIQFYIKIELMLCINE